MKTRLAGTARLLGRLISGLFLAAMPGFTLAQAQQPGQSTEMQSAAQAQQNGAMRYGLVAADREIAWRIDHQTGEVAVCRVNPTSFETITAMCNTASMSPQSGGGALGGLTGGNGQLGTAPEQQEQQPTQNQQQLQ